MGEFTINQHHGLDCDTYNSIFLLDRLLAEIDLFYSPRPSLNDGIRSSNSSRENFLDCEKYLW